MDSFRDVPLSDYRRNEYQEMLVAPPIDLSYKKANTMAELEDKRPQTVRTNKAPSRTATGHFLSSTLWLSNNLLTSLEGLQNLARKVLEEPSQLSWLDVSFNEIQEISDEITQFPNLKILYFHGNNVSDMNEIVKLKKLPNLRTLSIHGNPIENIPCYRGYVIHILPQLTTLDFSSIILVERKKPVPTGYYKLIRNENT